MNTNRILSWFLVLVLLIALGWATWYSKREVVDDPYRFGDRNTTQTPYPKVTASTASGVGDFATPTPASATPTPTPYASLNPNDFWQYQLSGGMGFWFPKTWHSNVVSTENDEWICIGKQEFIGGFGLISDCDKSEFVYTYDNDVYFGSIDKYVTAINPDLASIRGGDITVGGKTGFVFKGDIGSKYYYKIVVFAKNQVFVYISNAHSITSDPDILYVDDDIFLKGVKSITYF